MEGLPRGWQPDCTRRKPSCQQRSQRKEEQSWEPWWWRRGWWRQSVGGGLEAKQTVFGEDKYLSWMCWVICCVLRWVSLPPGPSEYSLKLQKVPGVISYPGKLVRTLGLYKCEHSRGGGRNGPTTGSHQFKTEARKKKTQVRKCKGYPEVQIFIRLWLWNLLPEFLLLDISVL